MNAPVSLAAFRQQRLKLTPEERRFHELVHELREWPLPVIVEALIAARDVHELVGIVDELAALFIHCTTYEEKDQCQKC